MKSKLETALLEGSDYPSALRVLIAEATRRIWVVQFLIDARPTEDRGGEVRYLLHALAEARSRGVDVKVLLPRVGAAGAVVSPDLNAAPARFLSSRGVDVRRLDLPEPRPHCHLKLVVIDDHWTLIGNANWTPSGFRMNEECSVVLQGVRVTNQAAAIFERLRCSARPVELRPSVGSPLPFNTIGGAVGRVIPSVRPPLGRAYWPRRRRPSDPLRLVRDRGRAALTTYSSTAGRFLAGQRYVRRITELIKGANERVWVSMLGLKASTTRRTRALLLSLGEAHARGVDVRVLYGAAEGQPGLWRNDVGVLRELGVPALAWPLRSGFHMRAVIADDILVAGSVGWTPRSVFRSDELAVEIDGTTVQKAACNFEQRWCLASTKPVHWAASTVDDSVPSISRALGLGRPTLPESATTLAARRLMTAERIPLGVADQLSRAGVRSLRELKSLTGADLERLLAQAYPPKSEEDLVPMAAFLADLAERGAASDADAPEPR